MLEGSRQVLGRPVGTVYSFWSGDRCLYVGQSLTNLGRINNHKRRPFWAEGDRIELRHVGESEDINTIEREMISSLRPEYNIAHNPKRWEH